MRRESRDQGPKRHQVSSARLEIAFTLENLGKATNTAQTAKTEELWEAILITALISARNKRAHVYEVHVSFLLACIAYKEYLIACSRYPRIVNRQLTRLGLWHAAVGRCNGHKWQPLA